MMTPTCTCTNTAHDHHAGRACDRPAVSPAQEVDQREGDVDIEIGDVCLECYQLIAVEAHEKDPTAVLDLNVPPSFPICEAPILSP